MQAIAEVELGGKSLLAVAYSDNVLRVLPRSISLESSCLWLKHRGHWHVTSPKIIVYVTE